MTNRKLLMNTLHPQLLVSRSVTACVYYTNLKVPNLPDVLLCVIA